MKIIKRTLSLVLVFAFILSFAACKGNPQDASKIKNVIIIIGDGMGLSHITSGQLASGRHYEFTDWEYTNVNTNSLSYYHEAAELTDSAAAATALATGTLTTNGFLGKDSKENDLTTILDIAKENDKSTGIVTTDELTGATPSGFSAHCADRNNADEIISTQLSSNVNLLCGLYSDTYANKEQDIKNAKYTYTTELTNQESLLEKEKLLMLLPVENAESKDSIELKTASNFAIDYLSQDDDGFVLMIEQAHIDKYSHANDFENTVKRVNSLANTVDTVMEFAKDRDDTVVIVTADHETGALQVSAKDNMYGNKFDTENNKAISYSYYSTDHSNANVGMFIWGISIDYKSQSFYSSTNLIKNTDIFTIMKNLILKPKN